MYDVSSHMFVCMYVRHMFVYIFRLVSNVAQVFTQSLLIWSDTMAAILQCLQMFKSK